MTTSFRQPFRQIHLDFHTSEHITGIGDNFDSDHFAQTLEDARVNSINCFARCHHGWIYYDTERFPERRHPHLKRNLLKEIIDACHARDIRVPIYVTVQWDHFTARQHPDWVAVAADGSMGDGLGKAPGPYEASFRRALLVNSPYLDFLKEHVAEIFQHLPVDGLWFDIVKPLDDSSRWTQQGMEDEGLDPHDRTARVLYGQRVISDFKLDMTAYVHQFDPDCTVFYNEGHISPAIRPAAAAYTHYEIESLPSGEWGYAHFPIAARYTRTLGKEWLGMTGKFHTWWGDFHSFKNRAALEFECFQMLAFGAKCSIGDQLHPDGAICQTTYDLVGSVYRQVEEKEPWCVDATPIAEIGVLLPASFGAVGTPPLTRTPAEAAGAMRMLQEAGHQFDFIDFESNFTAYKVLILPDSIRLTQEMATKVAHYLEAGGKLIASYQSGLLPDDSEFALEALGVRYGGDAPYSPDFIKPHGPLGKGLPETEHVMYLRGAQVEAINGGTILLSAIIPYFNRTYRHFCSHQHTPSSHQAQYPAIVGSSNTVYFMHPIFTQYNTNAPRWVKQLFLNALDTLLPQPLLRHDGPSTVIATLTKQHEQHRIVHLLHYIPVRVSRTIDVIEDTVQLHDLTVSVRIEKNVTGVRLVPQNEAVIYQRDGDYVSFTLPTLQGHQMIVLNMA